LPKQESQIPEAPKAETDLELLKTPLPPEASSEDVDKVFEKKFPDTVVPEEGAPSSEVPDEEIPASEEEVPEEEEHVFAKPATAVEKDHFKTVLKANQETIKSLRTQLIEAIAQRDALSDKLEKLNKIEE
jgi:hypothetical protein